MDVYKWQPQRSGTGPALASALGSAGSPGLEMADGSDLQNPCSQRGREASRSLLPSKTRDEARLDESRGVSQINFPGSSLHSSSCDNALSGIILFSGEWCWHIIVKWRNGKEVGPAHSWNRSLKEPALLQILPRIGVGTGIGFWGIGPLPPPCFRPIPGSRIGDSGSDPGIGVGTGIGFWEIGPAL